MDITGKHIAIVVHDYFEQSEFEEPLSALQDAGGEVTIISASGRHMQGMTHIDKADTFEADLLLQQASSDDYDALVIPGGVVNADNLRVDEAAQAWVRDFLESGRPLAVICHGPWLLISADVLDGRHLTSFHTLRDDIVNAGGDWMDEPVVIDDNLITSRKPDDLPKFNDALITELAQQSNMKRAREQPVATRR